MSPKVTVIFEAHATSLDNEQGISSGHLDSPLSEVGIKQAVELGARHKRELALVCCSDLTRSRATAEIAFHDRLHLLRVDPRLRECNYGTLNGAPHEEIARTRMSFIADPYPAGESYTGVVERIRYFLLDLLTTVSVAHPVLVIGHRATQYGLECILNGRRLEDLLTEPWQWQPGWTYSAGKSLLA